MREKFHQFIKSFPSSPFAYFQSVNDDIMDHHANAVLFEPKERLDQRSFQACTFYRLWFVEDGLVQPYQEEWNENTADDESR